MGKCTRLWKPTRKTKRRCTNISWSRIQRSKEGRIGELFGIGQRTCDAAIVYWVIAIVKYAVKENETFKRFIPLIAAGLGVILGVVAYYLVPGIVPADNVVVAIIVGGASGLTATGVNQMIKQLGKGDGDEQK